MSWFFKTSASSLAPSVASSNLPLEEEAPREPVVIRLQRLLPSTFNQEFLTSLEVWDLWNPYTTNFGGHSRRICQVTCSDLNLHPPFHRHCRYRITFPGAITEYFTFVGYFDLDPLNHNGEEWVHGVFVHPDIYHQQHLRLRIPRGFVWVGLEHPRQDAVEQHSGWWRQALSPAWGCFQEDRD